MQEFPTKARHNESDIARMQQFRETSGGLNISSNALDAGTLKEGRLVGRNLGSKPVTAHKQRLRTEQRKGIELHASIRR